jgi:hypothetical protein
MMSSKFVNNRNKTALPFVFVWLLALLSPIYAFSQNVKQEWNHIEDPNLLMWSINSATVILGVQGSDMFTYIPEHGNYGNNSYYIQKFSNNKLVWKVDVALKSSDGQKIQFVNAVMIKGGIAVFGCLTNKKNKTSVFYQQFISPQDGSLIGSLRELESFPYSKQYDNYSQIFNFAVSPDSSKVLITHFLNGEEKNEKFLRVAVKVYDISYKEIWETQFKIENCIYFDKYEDLKVDNKGNAFFIVGFSYHPNAKGEIYPSAKIFVVTAATKEANEIKLPENQAPIHATFEFDLSNRLVLSGSCGEQLGSRKLFIARLDPEMKNVALKTEKKYDEKLMSEVNGQVNIALGRDAYPEHKICKLIPLPDKGFMVVSQMFSSENMTNVSHGSATTGGLFTDYFDVFISRVDENLNFLWTKSVRMMYFRQAAPEWPYGSALPIVSSKYFYLYFKDNSDNLNIPLDKMYAKGTKINRAEEGGFYDLGKVKNNVEEVYILDLKTGNILERKVLDAYKTSKRMSFKNKSLFLSPTKVIMLGSEKDTQVGVLEFE